MFVRLTLAWKHDCVIINSDHIIRVLPSIYEDGTVRSVICMSDYGQHEKDRFLGRLEVEESPDTVLNLVSMTRVFVPS